MKTGAELIAKERERQLKIGWSAEHDDDRNDNGDLALAGASYAIQVYGREKGRAYYHNLAYQVFPFDVDFYHISKDPIRQLAKAGALIAAEIDRLQRLNISEK